MPELHVVVSGKRGIWQMSYATARKRGVNSEINKLYPEDRAVHEWYRFVMSFPPHLVRDYLRRFGVGPSQRVLDPFCGTGTVLVESKKLGIPSAGIEANPMAHFASAVKVDWDVDPDGLVAHAHEVAQLATERLRRDRVEDRLPVDLPKRRRDKLRTLSPEAEALLLKGSISPRPLHKTLVLLECLEQQNDPRFAAHERLALAKTIVVVSNLHFGPEVGVGQPNPNASVIAPWLATIKSMANDLLTTAGLRDIPARAVFADARRITEAIEPASIDVVFTSPPYPNEKDYTRATRLESVLLGFVQSKAELRAMKQHLLRSNTRNVFKADADDEWANTFSEVQRIADEIEARRIAMGKTSGFERLYARATKLYFGGMARHLAELRPILRPGARLAYVVGDQASYLQVHIPTGSLLATIGQSLGYELEGIEVFRTRLATTTRMQLFEEVVILRWPS